MPTTSPKVTTLILGAGASKPYGLPLGGELRDAVLKIGREKYIRDILPELGVVESELQDFINDLRTSGSRTVDSFIGQRPQWMRAGKLAIAMALYAKEREARLLPPGQPKDHWYEALWNSLGAKSWAALKRTHVRVITFNYDRTLECYLSNVISNNFHTPRSLAADWLAKDFIIRPHGILGPYTGSSLSVFASHPNLRSRFLKGALRSLLILSEAETNSPKFREARKRISVSDRILFLGFGYHEENMVRLGFPLGSDGLVSTIPSRSHPRRPSMAGTHKGIGKSEWNSICYLRIGVRSMASSNWRSMSHLVDRMVPPE